MKLVLIKSFGRYEAQEYYGGVTGGKHIIARCRNGFTMQFPNECIAVEVDGDAFNSWQEVDDYFKKNHTEYFV